MKKIVLITSLFFCLSAIGQTVPKTVEAAFKKLYPTASDAEWTTYSDSYVSEFVVNDSYKAASFDKSGKWIQTSSQVDEESLPQAVKTYVTSKFGEDSFESAEFVETQALKYYSINVVNEDGETTNIALDTVGKLVKVAQEQSEEEEYEEDEE